MTLLSLDISSKTGWAVLKVDGSKTARVDSGTVPQLRIGKEVYPLNMLNWAAEISKQLVKKIEEVNPDVVVVEETSKGSKNAMSQKILEYVHFLMATYFVEHKIKVSYLLTGEWRVLTGCQMTSAEKKRNKAVRDGHKKGVKVVKNTEGKRIGLVSKKHVNVRRANEVFGLSLVKKNEDEADALLLGYAYLLKEKLVEKV